MADGFGQRSRSSRPDVIPRQRSRSHYGNSFLGHCCPTPYMPPGDGAVRPVAFPNRAYSYPAPNPGVRTLFNSNYQPGRRGSFDDSDFMTAFLKKSDTDVDLQESPLHQVSKTALGEIGQLLNSNTLRRTASTILSSVARVGSGIINTGIEMASNLFELGDPDIGTEPPKTVPEVELTCKGFSFKGRGKDLDLLSVHLEKNGGLRFSIELGPGLEFMSSPVCDHDKLVLAFQHGNRVEVKAPTGTTLRHVNWSSVGEDRILTLHVQ